MKRLFLCTLSFVTLYLSAVNYCAPSSWGYAGTTVTGGGNATPTVVKSESELKNALKDNNKVILITQNITISNQISSEKSNLTILALPGKKLISTQQSKEESGILMLKGSNIILRNIIFEGPGAYDCDGKDLQTLSGANKVWVDHCDFQDGCDGNFDINGKADNITVSWCRFRYLKEPKAGGPGGADDHRFTNLVGSSVYDKPADGTYNITYGFCWWDEGCVERMTRCRNALIHYLNCYWNSSVSNYYVCPEYASGYFEGCTFAGQENSNSKNWKEFKGTEGQNYCAFVNCTGKGLANAGSVAAPTYAYDQLTAATAKNYVTNTSCGAGATLTVTEEAKVSSSCDGEVPPVDPPTPVIVDGNCCVDLSLGEVPTVANAGIPADFSQLAITVNLVKGTWDPGFLNMGGNADYITFDFSAYDAVIEAVEFDVTIPNWAEGKNTVAYHWNNESNTQHPIASSATETVSLKAPAEAHSFTIQRSAGTSTRISGICFQIKSAPSGIDIVESQKSDTHKILHEGQIYLMYNGTIYDVQGRKVRDRDKK